MLNHSLCCVLETQVQVLAVLKITMKPFPSLGPSFPISTSRKEQMAPEYLPGVHSRCWLTGLAVAKGQFSQGLGDGGGGQGSRMEKGTHTCQAPCLLTPDSDLHPLPWGDPWVKATECVVWGNSFSRFRLHPAPYTVPAGDSGVTHLPTQSCREV